MAWEKLGKAHLIQTGVSPTILKTSHGYVAKPLPVIIKQEIGYLKQRQQSMGRLMTHVKHLAREIELLNPAVQRGGRRQDNCEYPWETPKRVRSPLDHSFVLSGLIVAPAGRAFLKLLRSAIDRSLG